MAVDFDLDQLVRDPQLVAMCAPADDVFSFLNRQVSVPASVVALVYGKSAQPVVVGAGKPIEADGVHELLFVRSVAFQLEYRFDRLQSKGGYDCSAAVEVSVRLVPERTELEAFRRTLLGSGREVRQKRLLQHCEEAVHSALTAFAKSLDVEELLSPERWSDFDAVLAERFRPVGFESGLAIGSDPRVSFESPAWAESRREREAAAVRQNRREEDETQRKAAAEARQAHLADLEEMLSKVKAMASDSGGLSVPELVKSFDVAQRGQLYHGLMTMHKPARRTSAILVVTGSELLWFDPADLEKPMRRLKLPKEAGALRSVRVAGGRSGSILVGARHGVHLLDADGENVRTYWVNDRPEVRGGVNSAVTMGDRIYATHSEIGLIRWKRDEFNQHELRLTDFTEGSRSVRDVQTPDGHRLWLTVDNLVVGWAPSEEGSQIALPAPSEVTTMSVDDGCVTAGLRDGSIVRWLIGDPKNMETVRGSTGAPVRSVACMNGGGVPRLLIGGNRQYLELQVLGDSYHGEYRCLHELRWGFAAEDLIVGVNDRRDHVFLWDIDKPEQTSGAVAVRRLTGRSIQDVALVTDQPVGSADDDRQQTA